MAGKWAEALVPGNDIASEFEELLRERIDRDYEVTEELVGHILEQLRVLTNKQDLQEDLVDVFEEEGAGVMATWCWDTLEQLTTQELEPTEPGTPVRPADSASPARVAGHPAGHEHSKRAPICFSLDSSVSDIAPKKASQHKAQQLGGKNSAAEHPAASTSASPPSAAAAAAAKKAPAAAADRPSRALAGSSSASGRQRAPPAASARLLSRIGLIRPAEGSTAPGSGRDARSARPRQQDVDRGTQQPRSEEPREQQRPQDQQQRKRPLEEVGQGREAGRPAHAGSRRGGASGAAAGMGSVFRSAMDGLKSDKGSKGQGAEQTSPQQPRAGSGGVFARIAAADLAKLAETGMQLPKQQLAAAAKQRSEVRQPQSQQQPDQQQDPLQGLPKSLQGRLGMGTKRSPVAAAAAAAGKQTNQPSASAAAAEVGTKRKTAAPEAQAPAAATGAAAPAGAAPAASKAPQQQQHEQQEAPAKKARTTAGPAATAAAAAGSGGKAGSKADELAALRAQLEARQAEVQRLKQAQESDHCSVVVFGLSPRAPESVVLAHFSGCGSIKRCTLLPARLVSSTAPGAYLEFQGSGAAAGSGKAGQQAATNALLLSGTMLLDQKITVTRKSEWKANQAKGQRAYTAMRAAAVQPSGPATRNWKASGGAGGPGTGGPSAAAGLDVLTSADVAEG